MAAEGAAAAAAAPLPPPPPRGAELAAQAEQEPFCSSTLCRGLSSLPFFVAGAFLIRSVRHAVDGQPERLRKPTVFARMGLGLCLLSWGLTQLVFVPKKKRDP